MSPDLMAKFQNERQGKLGDRCCAITWDVCDGDALGVCGFYIDDIIAGRQDTNVSHAGDLIEDLFREERFVREDDFSVADGFDHRGGSLISALVHDQFTKLVEAVPAEISGVQSVAIQDNDFHVRRFGGIGGGGMRNFA